MVGTCDIVNHFNFTTIWAVFAFWAPIVVTMAAFLFFKPLYVNASYETWIRKTSPKYPPAKKVGDEIWQAYKANLALGVVPAIAVWLAGKGYSKAYCGIPYGFQYEVRNFFLMYMMNDFWVWFQHWCEHQIGFYFHKTHHTFFNPTPFSSSADELFDGIARGSAFLIFPLFMEVNMDLMFIQFFFVMLPWGLYIHMGHEVDWLDSHHPWISTSFQHFMHHARSPKHCGFGLKIWDQMVGNVYKFEGDPKKCVCAKCCRGRGERTLEKWEKVEVPDYSVLLTLNFWREYFELPESLGFTGPSEPKKKQTSLRLDATPSNPKRRHSLRLEARLSESRLSLTVSPRGAATPAAFGFAKAN